MKNNELALAFAKEYARFSQREQLRYAQEEVYRRFSVFAKYRPLAHGIHTELMAALPQFDGKIVRRVIQVHCLRLRYLKALRSGGARFDLYEREVGRVSEVETEEARMKLEKMNAAPASHLPEDTFHTGLDSSLEAFESEQEILERDPKSYVNALVKMDKSFEMPKKMQKVEEVEYSQNLGWEDDTSEHSEFPIDVFTRTMTARSEMHEGSDDVDEKSLEESTGYVENVDEDSVHVGHVTASSVAPRLHFQFVTTTNDTFDQTGENFESDFEKIENGEQNQSDTFSVSTKFVENAQHSETIANILLFSKNSDKSLFSSTPEMAVSEVRAPIVERVIHTPRMPRVARRMWCGGRLLVFAPQQTQPDPVLQVANTLREVLHGLGEAPPRGRERVAAPRFLSPFKSRHYASRTGRLRKANTAAKPHAKSINVPPMGTK